MPTIPRTVALVLLVAACGVEETDPKDGLVSARDRRYCEVLPIYLEDGALRADVFNTLGHNDCPDAQWEALDDMDIAEEMGAAFTVLNGPRYFLMDELDSAVDPSTFETDTFGGLTMSLVASLSFVSGEVTRDPYAEQVVNRDTRFTFWEGSEVYELLAPDGSAYVMQSYALMVDPSLTADALAGLGQRLTVPDGWTWRTRVLDADLEVRTAGAQAVVVQDELENTYQRYWSP